MSKSIKVSLIVPCLNEKNFIGDCVESLLSGTFPVSDLEVLICDGGSTDGTLEVLTGLSSKYKNVRVLKNRSKTTPFAFNLGIENALGEYIAIIGAHSHFPKDYIEVLYRKSHELKAANVGCGIRTTTKSETQEAISIRAVLSDKLGVGNSKFRTGSGKLEAVDTVPFGFYHKSAFEKYGLFDVRLTRGQDIEFNKRLILGGEKIYLIPDLEIVYFAREKLVQVAKNAKNTGFWVIYLCFLTRTLRAVSLRHFAPFLFVLGSLFSFYMCVGLKDTRFLALPGAYSLLILFRSMYLRKKNNRSSLLYIFLSFICLHVFYGVGSLFASTRIFGHFFLYFLSRLFALLIFLVFSPIMLIIGIAVRASSKGAAIHWSSRVGQNNKIFKMPKFRTMYIGTPDVASHLLENTKSHVTPLGRFLRKTSLDELPQLYSILVGDMNFVGPRPALFNQDDLVALRNKNGTSKIKPGITGWAQIHGRDSISVEEKAKLDGYYFSNMSLGMNLKIILRTILIVLRRNGITH